ncbi:MAG: uridine kinase [Longimicrobiales bacterium]
MAERILLGVAGGSGSGKTTVVEEILKGLRTSPVSVIHHDAYYRDLSHRTFEERVEVNFDHPDALETELLVEHLGRLRAGEGVDVPVYDFSTHTRRKRTRRVEPTGVIIVDGILVLADPRLRELLDIKVFVDTDPDLRFIRRLGRDMKERGRSLESVVEQYLRTVRPMHLAFVEGSRAHADIIIPEGGQNQVAIDLLVGRLGMVGR